MNKEMKKKWLKALRSGDYDQGTSFLCAVDNRGTRCARYCCLGVLQELVSGEDAWTDVYGSGFLRIGYEGFTSMPDSGTLKTVGLDYLQARKLATMNDKGKSFEEIADWIEENL